MNIELEKLGRDHPINRAMRRIARYWPVVYAKLLCLDWQWVGADGSHPAASVRIKYGATNGVILFLNKDGVDLLVAECRQDLGDAVGYVAFLLVHEGVHAILNHGFRLAKFTCRDTIDRAADYKVNEIIAARNNELNSVMRVDVFPLPPWCLFDITLSAPWSTEQLYQQLRKDELEEETQEETTTQDETTTQPGDPSMGDPDLSPAGDGGGPDPAGPDGQDGGGTGSPEPGDQSPESHDPSRTGGQDPGPKLDKPAPGADGDGGGGGDALEPAGNLGGDGEAGRPGDGSGDTFPPLAQTPEVAAEIERAIEEQNERLIIQDGIENHQCGSDPATSRRLVGERNAAGPQDWCALAEQFVDERCRKGWRARYDHGTYVATGMCGPGREGKKLGDIIVVADSSGSIGAEAWDRFFGLTRYILDDIRPERMLLVSCAKGVKDHLVLERGDTVPCHMRGGGGTSFKAAFDWVDEQRAGDLDIDPLLLIYFTDGICEDHKDMPEPDYPVLWLSYKKPRDHFPWGEFAEITVT